MYLPQQQPRAKGGIRLHLTISLSSAVALDEICYSGHSGGLCCCTTSRQLSVLEWQSCGACNKLAEYVQKRAVKW